MKAQLYPIVLGALILSNLSYGQQFGSSVVPPFGTPYTASQIERVYYPSLTPRQVAVTNMTPTPLTCRLTIDVTGRRDRGQPLLIGVVVTPDIQLGAFKSGRETQIVDLGEIIPQADRRRDAMLQQASQRTVVISERRCVPTVAPRPQPQAAPTGVEAH